MKIREITEEWKPLNEKAREYYEITRPLLEEGEGKIYFESGRDPDTKEMYKFEIDSRSEEQKELAGEIVEEVVPYLHKIAKKLLKKNCAVNVNGKERVLSLKSLNNVLEEDELVTQGALSLMRALHNHNPDKGSISTFVHYNGVFGMHRYAAYTYPGIINIPVNVISKVRPTIVETSRRHVIDVIKRKFRASENSARIIYESITGEHRSIHETIGGRNSSPSNLRLEETLADNSPNANVRYQTEASLMKEKMDEVLGSLTEREEKVLNLRFGLEDGYPCTLGEVGSQINVTNNRVRQIEAKALRKMRHPTRARELHPYTTIRLESKYGEPICHEKLVIEPWEIAEGIKVEEV